MGEDLLQIDVSNFQDKIDENSVRIRFQNEDSLQVNFSKLFIQSRYIQDKYKYPEAINSIQSEIDEIEKRYNINEKSIKYFIQLIQEEKVSILIEHYKDIYTLSEYFAIPKFTAVLDKIGRDHLFKDLDFTIQILIDSETANKSRETGLTNKIENFLIGKINECIKNEKFKELQVSTIYRIIDQCKEKVDLNLLVDFIFESAKATFILLKFVEINKLEEQKIDELIRFIDEQDEKTKKMCLECMVFDFSFIKNMKDKYDKVYNNMNQAKQELNQIKQEFDQTKQELNQTKQEFDQIKQEYDQMKQEYDQMKQEFDQTKQELNQTKQEFDQKKSKNVNKQCTQSIIVCGLNKYNQLTVKTSNKNPNGSLIIHPPEKLSIDPSSLLSYSTYCYHSVLVTSNGSLKGVGCNGDGRISTTLQKTFKDFTDFSIKDSSGHQLSAISAVCYISGTLYMFSKSSGNERQLVLCDSQINGGTPVFLNIGNHHPVSLFGGHHYSASIGSEGEVIFINRNSIKNSPNSPISSVSLPDGEKASSIACCEDTVYVLSSKGRVFSSSVNSNGVLKFSSVSELLGYEIVCFSGKHNHCLAVSKEGCVFGRGSNRSGQLGLGEGVGYAFSFKEITSLVEYEIRAVYAGSRHSLFETREGKIFSCGHNFNGELLLSNGPGEDVYLPTETMITRGASFCIAGDCLSVVFFGSGPPPKTPNMPI